MQYFENSEEGIKSLNIYYIFHLIFYSFIFALLVVLYYVIYWLNKYLLILFLICTYFGLIFVLFPITPIYLIHKKRLNSKIIYVLRKLSIILIIISIFIGLMISIVFFFNTKYSIDFCKECPFSYSLSHLNYTFNYFNTKFNEKELKKKCNIERCILYNENEYEKFGYSYLCNYNPLTDIYNEEGHIYSRELPNRTIITSKSKFMCYELGKKFKDMTFDKENNEIYSNYLNTCLYTTKFYLCHRFDKPKIYYDMGDDKICPSDDYLFLLYIICLLLTIMQILITLLLWCIEYTLLKELSNIIVSNNNKKNNSIYSTRTNTEKSRNNHDSFKKEPTLVIVIPLNERKNNNNPCNNRLTIKNSEECGSGKKINPEKDKKISISSPRNGNSERINLHIKSCDIELNKK